MILLILWKMIFCKSKYARKYLRQFSLGFSTTSKDEDNVSHLDLTWCKNKVSLFFVKVLAIPMKFSSLQGEI